MRAPTDEFWDRVQSAERRILMLDYDGTLAPFKVSRMEALPPEPTHKILRTMVDENHTHVVVVSGRAAAEVRELLELDVETFGAHGFERSPRKGTVHRQSLSPTEKKGLEKARTRAVATGLERFVEVKPASIAVHVRGLGPRERLEVEELAYNVFTPIAKDYDLECRAFDGGVEIRSRRFHKGLAVDSLLERAPDGALAVYVGDDDTDEDAFRAIQGRGYGIRVGGTSGDTAAEYQLGAQHDVQRFLEEWEEKATRAARVEIQTETTGRLVVVSNRLPSVGRRKGRQQPVGGLATALAAALSQSEGGGLWVGWSGRTSGEEDRGLAESRISEGVTLAGLDLTRREYEAYYNGFANKTIWPLFHSFPTHADLSVWQLEVYKSVNAMFAHALAPTLRKNDVVWVHDYHLMFLGRELRRADWGGRLGFFLHIPFPSLDILGILPEFTDFLRALHEFDLIGFQTTVDRDNYVYASQRKLGAEWDGKVLQCGTEGQRVGVYPIGIDVDKFLPGPGSSSDAEDRKSMRTSLGSTKFILGVDRLDYTKGIPERALAFEILFKLRPELKRNVSFIQICSPSRTGVQQYREQKELMDTLVGRINGGLAEFDWEPMRYLYRSYPQSDLVGFYNEASVGLVTPLRDGMNLVAKEYVAAQNSNDPGVLVLSQFAGAAEELAEAVVVNPYVPESTAQGMLKAIEMPLEERRQRHGALLERIRSRTIHKWARDFLNDLKQNSC